MIEAPQLRSMARSAAFISINTLALLFIVYFLVLPVTGFFQSREEEIIGKRALLARFMAVAEQETNVRKALQSIEAEAQHGEFLQGKNDSEIIADLQTRLKSITDAAGARLRSVQGIPPRTDGLRYSGVRIDIEGSLQSLYRTIRVIESVKPYLFVADASIKAPSANVSGPNGGREPILQAQIDVLGAVLVEVGP
jgi:hypothetical protein